MTKQDATPPPSTFVATIDITLAPQLIQDLEEQGFTLTTPMYTIFSAKKQGISCTLYQSGKLTVQGKEMGPFIEFYLEPHILQQFSFTYRDRPEALETDTSPLDTSARIGIDESGKGDFFGPLCVAGVFAKGDEIIKLKQIGVRDSKSLSPKMIQQIAHKIRQEFTHHIVKINPPKYNELMEQFQNLNSLLAWGHATAIEQLTAKTGCRSVIIDQFANERVVLSALKRKDLELDLTQRHRGEEDVVVAAASILARNTFVEGMEALEKQFGQSFPKGCSKQTVAAGKLFVRNHGREALFQVAKLHFKTLDEIVH